MVDVSIQEMMEAGAHFGHQTRRWNPKMRPYLYGSRSGVHIIDLQKTLTLAKEALDFISKTVASGKEVLFVGTKNQARNIMREQAEKSQMFYVNNRWMGGTLTNYPTIKKSINRLIDFETRRENDGFEGYTKKELLDIDRTIEKLTASLGGIKLMQDLPGVIFIVDPNNEKNAVSEARKLKIPVVAIVDSNCNPDPIDFIIPANDDALSSIEYIASKVTEACLEGLEKREQYAREVSQKKQDEQADKPKAKRRVASGESTGKSYVAKAVKEDQSNEGAEEGSFSAKAEEATSETGEKAVNAS